ncbi:MAG TPA: lytic transglycosylase domain-containing protein [Acidisoma sp.]|uniref:lytic transglycosylase domain-containing protein n=1 Tax=Acidisoma sp. TaxID=1872115 RepID=UPI002D086ACB|nr:lytic transglycosylase domain-containing protein [Acidisoma sp.]HTI01312.1 lytic transglycosylase domain-containing protein [Acidisoma sp.]
MRGIGSSFSRLFSPKAIIAGAAILAGTAAPGLHADAQEKAGSETKLSDQSAYAVPRSAPEGGDAFAFPQPLNPSDAVLVRQIFALQAKGKIADAEKATAQLSNRMLLGAILADRYTGPYTKPSAATLKNWLDSYGDQPEAPAIAHVLSLRLHGTAGSMPTRLQPAYLSPPTNADGADFDMGPPDTGVENQPGLDSRVLDLAHSDKLAQAVSAISAAKISQAYGATLRAEVAHIAFANGHNAFAANLAHGAIAESHGKLGLPPFIAGLAAWVAKDAKALDYFTAAAGAPQASSQLRAAASFWAARSALRQDKQMLYLTWLRRAAASGSGFYATLAQRILGQDSPSHDLDHQMLGLADLEAVASNPHGERAFALLQVGQTHLAEQELRALYPKIAQDPGMRRAVMLVAWKAGMATLASQIASLDPAHPPGSVVIPPLSLFPKHGLHVDPALLYALVRVESNFDPKAVSGAGARGLLQLMPQTAAFMNKWGATQLKRQGLSDPEFNLEMGQRYLRYLASQSNINGDLIRILASYNAGPSETSGWSNDQVAEHDPLLYIEMIPNRETRNFVFCVLRYSWAYAAQMNLPVPSLEALVQGSFPHLTGPSGVGVAIASSATIH